MILKIIAVIGILIPPALYITKRFADEKKEYRECILNLIDAENKLEVMFAHLNYYVSNKDIENQIKLELEIVEQKGYILKLTAFPFIKPNEKWLLIGTLSLIEILEDDIKNGKILNGDDLLDRIDPIRVGMKIMLLMILQSTLLFNLRDYFYRLKYGPNNIKTGLFLHMGGTGYWEC